MTSREHRERVTLPFPAQLQKYKNAIQYLCQPIKAVLQRLHICPPMKKNNAAYPPCVEHLLIFDIAMSAQDLFLELFGILIPELCSLTIQGGGT